MCYRTCYGQHVAGTNRVHSLLCVDTRSIHIPGIVTGSSPNGGSMVHALGGLYNVVVHVCFPFPTLQAQQICIVPWLLLWASRFLTFSPCGAKSNLAPMPTHYNSIPRTAYNSAFSLSFVPAQELSVSFSRNMYQLNFARRCVIDCRCCL